MSEMLFSLPFPCLFLLSALDYKNMGARGTAKLHQWHYTYCFTLLSTVSHNHITLLQIVKKCSRGRSNLFEVTNPWSNYWLRLLWCFLWLAWFMIILIILVQSHQWGMITCETKLWFLKPPVICIILSVLWLLFLKDISKKNPRWLDCDNLWECLWLNDCFLCECSLARITINNKSYKTRGSSANQRKQDWDYF